MEKSSEPRPQCPECGYVIHPEQELIIVSESEGTEIDDSIPDSLPLRPELSDVFTGLYCGADCVLDAMTRGWPEFRCI